MSELTCNECKSPLTGEILDDWTTCPSCGRRWQLTQEHDAIRSVTLVVHPARHKHTTKIDDFLILISSLLKQIRRTQNG